MNLDNVPRWTDAEREQFASKLDALMAEYEGTSAGVYNASVVMLAYAANELRNGLGVPTALIGVIVARVKWPRVRTRPVGKA